MKKILNYYFNKRLHIFGIITFILLLITFITLYDQNFIFSWTNIETNEVKYEAQNSPFGLLAFFGGALVTIAVPIEFSFKMNKITIDQMYSLPIKREKIFLTKYLICILEVVIPLTISFIFSFIMIVFQDNIFNLIYYIPYYFLLVFYLIVLTTIFAFIFTCANKFSDGVINLLAYSFILPIVLINVIEMFNIKNSLLLPEHFITYSPLSIIAMAMDYLLCGSLVNLMNSEIISLVFFFLIALVSGYLFIKLNKKEKSENCSEISESWFSFKVFIPIYSITLGSLAFVLNSPTLYIFVAIATYISYVIKNRNFKIKRRDYQWLIISLIAGFILGMLTG